MLVMHYKNELGLLQLTQSLTGVVQKGCLTGPRFVKQCSNPPCAEAREQEQVCVYVCALAAGMFCLWLCEYLEIHRLLTWG